MQGLGLDTDESLPHQMDVPKWPVLRKRFTELFLSRTRDEWARVFDGLDACVTPVLEIPELMHHPHNRDRWAGGNEPNSICELTSLMHQAFP